MTEIAIGQIIKMVIAVVVAVVVIFGIYLIFTTYIIPSFTGGGDDDGGEYEGAVYSEDALKEIVVEKNEIGEFIKEDGKDFIYLNGKSEFYREGDKIMMVDKWIFGWDWIDSDEVVGKVHYPGDYGVIVIEEEDLGIGVLSELNNAVLHGDKIYNAEYKTE